MKAAILGFAHGHVNGYIAEWLKDPDLGVRPVAGWDHDTDRLAKSTEPSGLEPVSDLSALLARREIESVVIAAETSRHAELVELAAQANKAIVLQKPAALTLAEADRIVAAVERFRVPFTVAWQMRTDPQNVCMKTMIDSGALGRIYGIRRRHGLGLHLNPGFADLWHADPALNRDIWADDAAHPIDFIHWMLGKPESVTAEIMSLGNPRVPMDNGVALFRYPGGPLAEVSCSFTCAAAENTTEIFGERGVILQSFGDGPSATAPRPEGLSGLKWYLSDEAQWTYSDIPSPAGHWERILGLAKPLADFLNGRRPPLCTAREARVSLQMVLGCYVSVREGRRVSMDDPGIAAV